MKAHIHYPPDKIERAEIDRLAETLSAIDGIDMVHRIGRRKRESTDFQVLFCPLTIPEASRFFGRQMDSDPSHYSVADIRVGNSLGQGRYSVTIETAAGDASDTLRLDPAEESLRRDLQAIEDSKTDEDFFVAFGKRLFNSLLPGPVAGAFRAALGQADGEGKRLRVRLRLRPPDLSAIPWEFLYDPDKDLFLGISSKVVVSRYVVDAPAAHKPMPTSPPLRLLVAFSSPTDVMSLDVERERQVLIQATQKAVNSMRLELHFLNDAHPHMTNAALRTALRDVRPHIFHFVGHGEFDGKRGCLLFEDDAGKTRRVRGQILREFFEDTPDVKLVVLNACQGAATSTERAFSGLAPFLVQRGLPAVIAMRYPIPDDSAVVFAREFYETLTRDISTAVDAAVAEGRRAIYQDVGPDLRDWGIPNVFLRANDGTIFVRSKTATETVLNRSTKSAWEMFQANVERLILRNRLTDTPFVIRVESQDDGTEVSFNPDTKSMDHLGTALAILPMLFKRLLDAMIEDRPPGVISVHMDQNTESGEFQQAIGFDEKDHRTHCYYFDKGIWMRIRY